MADFEGLIKQALASQNADDPQLRQRIYQSSRNALARMLDKVENQSAEAIQHHFSQLEQSITRIENEYLPPASDPQVDIEQLAPVQEPVPAPENEPVIAPQVETNQPVAEPVVVEVNSSPEPIPQQTPQNAQVEPELQPNPVPDQQNYSQHDPNIAPEIIASPDENIVPAHDVVDTPVEPYLGDITDFDSYVDEVGQYEEVETDLDPAPVYKRKNPILRRIWPLILVFAVLLVILWILYALFANMDANNNAVRQGETDAAIGEVQEGDDGSIYITLLKPTDLSALITSGRGAAELVTVQSKQMLRVQSLRHDGSTDIGADPILLEIGKGILQQLSGKEVTVEFNAKSGTSSPAQFAIECDIAGDSVCGRKRFRVGQNPEKIVFAMDVAGHDVANSKAFLAINTDVTNSATSSGAGDLIDILYVRLRVSDPS